MLCKSESGPWVLGGVSSVCWEALEKGGCVILVILERAAPRSNAVDTKQRLCLQGYLMVNKSSQAGGNPLHPGTLSCPVSTAEVAQAVQAGGMQNALAQAHFYSCRSPQTLSLTLSPRLACQGFKRPKFLTTLKPFLLSVCFHLTCGSSWCSMGPSALL